MPVKTKTKKSAAKKHGGLTMIPLRSWIFFWFFILVTMTLVIVCFTNAFRSIDREANRETAAAFQVIRQNLEAQVAELQGQLMEQSGSGPDVDGSIDGVSTQTGPCPVENYLTYTEPRSKVQMRLPFAKALEDGRCQYFPPEFSFNTVSFGEYNATGGEIHHDSSLVLGAFVENAADLKRYIDTQRANPSIKISNFIERNINGLAVSSFTRNTDGGPDEILWVIFGKTFSYELFTKTGWLTDAEAVKIIQSLKVVK